MNYIANLGAYRRILADLALLVVTMVWGVTFVVIKNALADTGPFWFISGRFLLAFGFLAVLFTRRLATAGWQNVRTAGFIGIALFAGFALQTIGLQYTTAAKSGFITGLSVVLVPVVGRLWGQKGPGTATLAGIACAILGLGLLTLDADLRLNYGDFFTLLSAVAFACHIVMVGHYVPHSDVILLTILQIGAVGLASTVTGLAIEPLPVQLSEAIWLALAVTAIPATALALLIQNAAQRFTTPARTALVFAMEPVFAGLAAYFFLGEILTVKQLAGCGLIVAGMVVSEVSRP